MKDDVRMIVPHTEICYVYSTLMKSRMWHVTMIEPQLSKDWNNYWRLIRSVSIGKIDGIFSMVLIQLQFIQIHISRITVSICDCVQLYSRCRVV